MLVLSRRKGEALVIGNAELEITVIEIRGSIVRLGISGPAKVLRKELLERQSGQGPLNGSQSNATRESERTDGGGGDFQTHGR